MSALVFSYYLAFGSVLSLTELFDFNFVPGSVRESLFEDGIDNWIRSERKDEESEEEEEDEPRSSSSSGLLVRSAYSWSGLLKMGLVGAFLFIWKRFIFAFFKPNFRLNYVSLSSGAFFCFFSTALGSAEKPIMRRNLIFAFFWGGGGRT